MVPVGRYASFIFHKTCFFHNGQQVCHAFLHVLGKRSYHVVIAIQVVNVGCNSGVVKWSSYFSPYIKAHIIIGSVDIEVFNMQNIIITGNVYICRKT